MMSKVLYIYGAGHCGSTLVSIFLNSQANVLCAGEVWNISDVGLPSREAGGEVWNEGVIHFEKMGGDFQRLLSEAKTRFPIYGAKAQIEKARLGNDALLFLNSLAIVSGMELIVDTSKGWRRLDMLLSTERTNVYVLNLKRDGRAIVHSYLKKYDRRYLKAVQRWAVSVIVGWILQHRYPTSRWIQLRYEDFCVAPEAELERILSFTEIPTEETVSLVNSSKAYIALAGNRMRTADSITIKQDEEWRLFLAKPVRIAFDLFFGWLNFLHGYRPWR